MSANPDVLVVTVGLNPLPVALAILTLRPATVWLLHSRASAEESVRIAEVVADIAAERSDWAVPRIEHRVVDAENLAQAVSDVKAAIGELAAPFRLDYSGGTKVMTAAAVSMHIEAHRDDAGTRWRSVVDDATGSVFPSSPALATVATEATGMTLERIARLHGYRLTGVQVDVQAGVGVDLSAPIAELFELVGDLDRRSETDLKDGSPGARERMPAVNDAIERRCRRIGLPATQYAKISDARGRLRELLVAYLVIFWLASHATERGEVSEVLFDSTVEEIADGARDVERGMLPAAQLDLIVRAGHRVMVVEVKSNAAKARTFVAERLMPNRWPFGTAVTSAVAAPEGIGQEVGAVTWADVQAARDGLDKALPALKDKVHAWQLQLDDTGAVIDDLSRYGLAQWFHPADAFGPSQPREIRVRGGAGHVLFAADGTPLAVQSALHFAAKRGVAVGVGPASRERELAFWNAARSAGVARSRAMYVAARGPLEQDFYSAAAAFGAQVSAVVLTPGPKVVAAGLMRYALERDADIVHLAVSGDVWTMGYDSAVGVSGFAPDWTTVLPAYYQQWNVDQVIEALASSGAQVNLVLALIGRQTVLFFGSPAATVEFGARAPLVLAGTRGCLSVHEFPGSDQMSTSMKDGRKQFRVALRTQAMHLSAWIGDAYKPLLINGDRAGRPSLLGHIVAQRWLPLLDQQRCRAEEFDKAEIAAIRAHLFGHDAI